MEIGNLSEPSFHKEDNDNWKESYNPYLKSE